jgi:hypothetical protein
MRHPDDNLDKMYDAFKGQPDALRRLYDSFNDATEKTYSAFKEIMEDHSYMGKASMIIMARNQATHILRAVMEHKGDYQGAVNEVTAAISPMFQMLYDRLVAETIEAELSAGCMEGEGN